MSLDCLPGRSAQLREDVITRDLTGVGFVVGAVGLATQRVGLSVGSGFLQVSTVVMLIFWVSLVPRKGTIDPTKFFQFLLLLLSTLISFVVNLNNASVSFGSWILFACVYLSSVFDRKDPRIYSAGRGFFQGTMACMRVSVLLAFVQALLQWLGKGWLDPLSMLPEAYLTPGFNSHYSLEWSGEALGMTIKPNGMLMLEPSFLSLYCGVCLVAVFSEILGSRRGERAPRASILDAIIFSVGITLSLSSSFLPVVAIAALLYYSRILSRPKVVFGVLCCVSGALMAGVLDPLLSKVTEGFSETTSTGLRLSVPYEILLPYWVEAPVFGAGPGTAMQSSVDSGLIGLQVPTLVKSLLEYGLVGTILLLNLAISAQRGIDRSMRALQASVIVAWVLPAEALLNSYIVALLFFCIPSMELYALRGSVRSPCRGSRLRFVHVNGGA